MSVSNRVVDFHPCLGRGGEWKKCFCFPKAAVLTERTLGFPLSAYIFNLGFLFVMGNTYLLYKILARPEREREFFKGFQGLGGRELVESPVSLRRGD